MALQQPRTRRYNLLWLVLWMASWSFSQCLAFQTRAKTTAFPPHRQRQRQRETPSFHRPSTNLLPPKSALSVSSSLSLGSSVHTVALVAGGTGLLAQWGLSQLLQRSSKTLKKHAAYTAHNAIALVFMSMVSGMGVAGWWATLTPATAAGRLLGTSRMSMGSSQWLASAVAGMIFLWDLPVSLAVTALRKPDVLMHHLGMAVTAYVAATILPMHYVYFYLGVSELSSIPLIVYDQLSVLSNDSDSDKILQKRLAAWCEQTKIVAALSFTSVRAVLFTKVTLCQFLPDVHQVLRDLPGGGVQKQALQFARVASVGFTALQLVWFWQMVRALLRGDTAAEEKKMKDKEKDDETLSLEI